MASWVWRQASRRASSGCVDEGVAVWLLEGGPTGAGRAILLRRVSGRPGADGAPFDGRAVGLLVVVLEACVA
jgi:hypothetical protein